MSTKSSKCCSRNEVTTKAMRLGMRALPSSETYCLCLSVCRNVQKQRMGQTRGKGRKRRATRHVKGLEKDWPGDEITLFSHSCRVTRSNHEVTTNQMITARGASKPFCLSSGHK